MSNTPAIFDPASLQRHIDASLASKVEPGHGNVRLLVTLDGKVSAIAMARIDDHWAFQGRVSADLKRKIVEGELTVEASW